VLAIEQVAASSFSGITAAVTAHPLNTWGLFHQIGQGMQARPSLLYRGVGTACLHYSFSYGLSLGVYDYARTNECSTAMAAGLSGFFEAMVNGPFETLTNRRQTGLRLPRTASARMSVLGKGTFAALLREAPSTQVYYHSYEWSQSRGLNTFLGGAIAGACCTACAFPLDSIRAQLVTGRPIRPTFRGMGPIMLAQALEAGVALKTYEAVATKLGFETSFNRTGVG